MNAIIEHVIRIIDNDTGQVLEHVKRDEIKIDKLVYRAKKYDIQFRYTATGKGDMAMGLKEIQSLKDLGLTEIQTEEKV